MRKPYRTEFWTASYWLRSSAPSWSQPFKPALACTLRARASWTATRSWNALQVSCSRCSTFHRWQRSRCQTFLHCFTTRFVKTTQNLLDVAATYSLKSCSLSMMCMCRLMGNWLAMWSFNMRKRVVMVFACKRGTRWQARRSGYTASS